MADEQLPKRIRLDSEEIASLTKEELLNRFREQDHYIRYLEKSRSRLPEGADEEDGDGPDEKLKRQNMESTRRENTLVLRLTNKEQELQDSLNQISEMKQAQTQSTAQLRTMLLDPALNLVFQRMAKEVDESKEKLKQTQNELSAWKFTPDSQTGKKLMAKCRMLLQENEELGKMIASGRTAKLEGEIALQKTLVQEMKKNQEELDEFVSELEEDVEGMQSMIYMLQTQLKDAKDQLSQLQTENQELRTMNQSRKSTDTPTIGSSNQVSNNYVSTISSDVETSTYCEDNSPVILKVRSSSPVPIDYTVVNHSQPESSQPEEVAMDTESPVNSGEKIDSQQPTSCDSENSVVPSRVPTADSTRLQDRGEGPWSPVNSRTDNNGAGDDDVCMTVVEKNSSVCSEEGHPEIVDVKPLRNGVEQVTTPLEVEESNV